MNRKMLQKPAMFLLVLAIFLFSIGLISSTHIPGQDICNYDPNSAGEFCCEEIVPDTLNCGEAVCPKINLQGVNICKDYGTLQSCAFDTDGNNVLDACSKNEMQKPKCIALGGQPVVTEFCQFLIGENFKVSGKVTDSVNSPLIADVSIKDLTTSDLLSPITTGSDGLYAVLLKKGSYSITASKSGYLAKTIPVTVSNADIILNFALEKINKGSISGKALDKDTNLPVYNAKLELFIPGILDPVTEFTDNGGNYKFNSKLGSETYTIKVSHKDYKSDQKQATISLEVTPPIKDVVLDFNLGRIASIPVSGVLAVCGFAAIHVPGAVVYVNDIRVGQTDSNGVYSFTLPTSPEDFANPSAKYTFKAFKEGFKEATYETGSLSGSGFDPRNAFCMTNPYPQCITYPIENSNLYKTGLVGDYLNSKLVKGKNSVNLIWKDVLIDTKCKDLITGYSIKRTNKKTNDVTNIFIPINPNIAKEQVEYLDSKLDWGATYKYEIKRKFKDLTSLRHENEVPVVFEFSIGNIDCKDKFDKDSNPIWFCIDQSTYGQCNEKNEIVPPKTEKPLKPYDGIRCAEEKPFCTPIKDADGKRNIECRPAKQENKCEDQNDVLGLYSTAETCEARSTIISTKEEPQYCYYDIDKTNVNACEQCSQVYTKGCFDYDSQETCIRDNCGFGNEFKVEFRDGCLWEPTAAELGKGYCYVKDYKGVDFCNRCSSGNEVFKNTGCTDNICGKLGACFQNEDASACQGCSLEPLTGCSSFKTAESCIGGAEVDKFKVDFDLCTGKYKQKSAGACNEFTIFSQDEGILTGQLDVCGWDNANKCFKDSDGDNQPDCGPNNKDCNNDYEPPDVALDDASTEPIPVGVNKKITFEVENSEDAVGSELRYLILNPEQMQAYDEKNPGNLCLNGAIGSSMPVDILDGKFKIDVNDYFKVKNKNTYIESGNYLLKYYTIDKNKNINEAQNLLLLVDLDVPPLLVEKEIIENKKEVTVNGEKKLEPTGFNTINIFVRPDPAASGGNNKAFTKCEDQLRLHDSSKPFEQQIWIDDQYGLTNYANTNKFVTFTPNAMFYGVEYRALQAGVYNYKITCEDAVGNVMAKEEKIEVLTGFILPEKPKPRDVISQSDSYEFRIKSLTPHIDETSCILGILEDDELNSQVSMGLVPGSQGEIILSANIGKDKPLYNKINQGLNQDLLAECALKFASDQKSKAPFVFTIDGSAPTTEAVFIENDVEQRLSKDKSNVYFVNPIKVSFSCIDASGCKQLMYGTCGIDDDKCAITPQSDYLPTVPESKTGDLLTISSSMTLCFRSTDKSIPTQEENIICGKVRVGELTGINLLSPIAGVADKPKVTLKVGSEKSECSYQTIGLGGELSSSIKLQPNTDKNEHIGEFEILPESLAQTYTAQGKELERKIKVSCKSDIGGLTSSKEFTITFDPALPKIEADFSSETSVKVADDKLGQISNIPGTEKAKLTIKSDDQVICIFSKDNMDNLKKDMDLRLFNTIGVIELSKDDLLLRGSFEGFGKELPDYKTEHSRILPFTAKQDLKLLYYSVICKDPLDRLTEVVDTGFRPDFRGFGFIETIEPKEGVYNLQKLPANLKAVTNKGAICSYSINGKDFTKFQSTGAIGNLKLEHTSIIPNKSDGKYLYQVKCDFASNIPDFANIGFIIDNIPPSIKTITIKEGATCQPDKITPIIDFVEANPDKLEYTLLESAGSKTVATGLMINGSAELSESLKLDTKYKLRVKITDLAGNSAESSSADFTYPGPKDPRCSEKNPPKITLSKRTIADGTGVRVNCEDENKCIFEYGMYETKNETLAKEKCIANNLYNFSVSNGNSETNGDIVFGKLGYLCWKARDDLPQFNNISGIEFVDVDVLKLTNINPPESGYDGFRNYELTTKVKDFDLEFETTRPANSCGVNVITDKDFIEDIASVPYFTETGDANSVSWPRLAKDKNTGKYKYHVAVPVNEFFILIKCDEHDQLTGKNMANDNNPIVMSVFFDNTNPIIQKASFEPSLLADKIQPVLTVVTDDKTICKFGNESIDSYENMQGRFEGFNEKIFSKVHSFVVKYADEKSPDSITIKFPDDHGKEFAHNIACKNPVDLTSEAAKAKLKIDWNALALVKIVDPGQNSYINRKDVTLRIETNRIPKDLGRGRFACQYLDFPNKGDESLFKTEDEPNKGRSFFSDEFKNLNDGTYEIPVSCQFDRIVEGRTDIEIVDTSFRFTIDTVAPTVNFIKPEDTCNPDSVELDVSIANNETVKVNYDLFELINPTKAIASGIAEGNRITGLKLEPNKQYFLKTKAIDLAGNPSEEKSGVENTFKLLPENDISCLEKDPPVVAINQRQVSKGMNVTISCTDKNGCTLSYGRADTQQACNPRFKIYNAEDDKNGVIFTYSQWICYEAKDSLIKPNVVNGSQLIDVKCVDADKDRICDGNDLCPNTALGAKVGSDGCEGIGAVDLDADTIPDNEDVCPRTPFGERSLVITVKEDPHYGCGPSEIDTDGDGLPDFWEMKFNKDTCLLDKAKKDSNSNGIEDGDEDCDKDKATNIEEYRAGTNPNDPSDIPSTLDTDEDGVPDLRDKCPNTPKGKSVDQNGCSREQRDSDNDGMDDSCEIKYLGGLSALPDDDNDKDGLTNKDECNRGTNPANKDTDGDGFSDGAEVKAGTDPLDPESKPAAVFDISKFTAVNWAFIGVGLLSEIGAIGYLVYKRKYKKIMPAAPKAAAAPKYEELEKQRLEYLRREEELRTAREFREKARGFKEERRKAIFERFAPKEKPEAKKPEAKEEEKPKIKLEIRPKEIKKVVEAAKEISKETEFEALASLASKHFGRAEDVEKLKNVARGETEFEELVKVIEKGAKTGATEEELIKLAKKKTPEHVRSSFERLAKLAEGKAEGAGDVFEKVKRLGKGKK